MFIAHKTLRINLDKVRRIYLAERKIIIEYTEEISEYINFNTEQEASDCLKRIDQHIAINDILITI